MWLYEPELHVSFISRYRSLTDDALRPSIAPMDAQSEPCFIRSLHTHTVSTALSQQLIKVAREYWPCGQYTYSLAVVSIHTRGAGKSPPVGICRHSFSRHTCESLVGRQRTVDAASPSQSSGRSPSAHPSTCGISLHSAHQCHDPDPHNDHSIEFMAATQINSSIYLSIYIMITIQQRHCTQHQLHLHLTTDFHVNLRDGKYHNIFKKIENIGYFGYISDIFDTYV